jgi:hypothetical protein
MVIKSTHVFKILWKGFYAPIFFRFPQKYFSLLSNWLSTTPSRQLTQFRQNFNKLYIFKLSFILNDILKRKVLNNVHLFLNHIYLIMTIAASSKTRVLNILGVFLFILIASCSWHVKLWNFLICSKCSKTTLWK